MLRIKGASSSSPCIYMQSVSAGATMMDFFGYIDHLLSRIGPISSSALWVGPAKKFIIGAVSKQKAGRRPSPEGVGQSPLRAPPTASKPSRTFLPVSLRPSPGGCAHLPIYGSCLFLFFWPFRALFFLFVSGGVLSKEDAAALFPKESVGIVSG